MTHRSIVVWNVLTVQRCSLIVPITCRSDEHRQALISRNIFLANEIATFCWVKVSGIPDGANVMD